MKTKSIKSIATLFGVAVILNASVLAGPGPQQAPVQLHKASDSKEVAVATTKGWMASASVKTVGQSGLAFTQVTGPHGVTYAYRSAASR